MAEYISKEKVLALFLEGAPDDNDFTIGYNFAVNEYRERVKAMKSEDVIERVISGDNCIICGRNVNRDYIYYDVNGGTICEACMETKYKCENGR